MTIYTLLLSLKEKRVHVIYVFTAGPNSYWLPMARELSFSVDRLVHQPSKVVVASSTLGALSLFNCPERICAPPHHPYSVVPAMPLVTVTHLMQQRTSLLATTIPTLWRRLPELGSTEQQNNEEQLPSEREKRNCEFFIFSFFWCS